MCCRRVGIPEGFTDLQCVPQLVCICSQKGNVHQALDKRSFSPIFKVSWLLISPWSSSCSQSSFQGGRHLLLHFFQGPLTKPAIYQSRCLTHYLLQQLLSRFVMYGIAFPPAEEWDSPRFVLQLLQPFCPDISEKIFERTVKLKRFTAILFCGWNSLIGRSRRTSPSKQLDSLESPILFPSCHLSGAAYLAQRGKI